MSKLIIIKPSVCECDDCGDFFDNYVVEGTANVCPACDAEATPLKIED
jgi:Zn finger protein HypA/HybF involved in hydrogenase expression